jgi:protocadherin delta 2
MTNVLLVSNMTSLFILALNVTESLDRETQDTYRLHLTVSDRGNRTSTVPIDVFISDINDNVPLFSQQTPYAINLSENTLPSLTQPILRLHAIDHDSGENGRIVYHYTSQVSESIRQIFQLNSRTGELYLLRSLDYEHTRDYRLQIVAQDSGPVSVPVYTTVIINVDDENDNRPTVTVRVSDHVQLIDDRLYVSEDTPINTLVMHVLVDDLDSHLNGHVQCWIDSSEHSLEFHINNTMSHMFSIYTGQRFDREQQANYSLRLIVEDQGRKVRHRTVRQMNLIINDINDCAPIFDQLFYKLVVHEEQLHRQALFRFHAHDNDTNENSRVTYELLSNDYQHLFDVNEQTGELFQRLPLNRELQSSYDLTIRARDHGTHPTSLFVDVHCFIQVLDRNEYRPMFDNDYYRFDHVREDLAMLIIKQSRIRWHRQNSLSINGQANYSLANHWITTMILFVGKHSSRPVIPTIGIQLVRLTYVLNLSMNIRRASMPSIV